MLYMWLRYGKPDPSMVANGMLTGLVAITAPCVFVTAPASVLIGDQRVSAEVEDMGLDLPEMGVLAYHPGTSTGDPAMPLPAAAEANSNRAAA